MIRTPNTKTCRLCGEKKLLESFHQSFQGRFGVAGRCAQCSNATNCTWRKKHMAQILPLQRRYNRTPGGKIMMAYHNMRGRTEGIQTNKAHIYKGLALLPRQVFYMWSLNDVTYKKLFGEWVKGGFRRNKAPSINRIDPKRGYELGNIEWLTQGENSRLGATKKGRG